MCWVEDGAYQAFNMQQLFIDNSMRQWEEIYEFGYPLFFCEETYGKHQVFTDHQMCQRKDGHIFGCPLLFCEATYVEKHCLFQHLKSNHISRSQYWIDRIKGFVNIERQGMITARRAVALRACSDNERSP